MDINVVEFPKKLSDNYLKLLDDRESFDVIINAGDSSNTRKFYVHSNILRCRSLYFLNKLAEIRGDNNNIKTIDLKHVSAQEFEFILKYIYGGIFQLNQDPQSIFKLMLISYEFFLDELAKYLETYLINEKFIWLKSDFSNIYKKCLQNDKLRDLQIWCNNIIVKQPTKIFDSEEFTSLPEKALISLVKRDDLQMEEVKIWNYIIKWGIAQNPDLPSNPNDWSPENFSALKATLQNCLPFIRYFQISGDDMADYLEPYKAILENDLWKDILKKNINPKHIINKSNFLPPRTIPSKETGAENEEVSSVPIIKGIPFTRKPKPFDSNIINEIQVAEIAMWIDKKTEVYSVSNNPYEFKLLLRGSKNGFTADAFWNICDRRENTVLIIKVKDTDEILGGYNPIKWDKSVKKYMKCDGSFIFSLKNGNIRTSILSRVKYPKYAINCNPDNGPCFGGGFGLGSDLFMETNFNQDERCYCDLDSYEKKIRDTADKFSVYEYEMFQISKKWRWL